MKKDKIFLCTLSVGVLFGCPAQGQTMAINWEQCPQPDRSSADYKKDLQAKIDSFLRDARRSHPSHHLAVALNRYYGEVVQVRRDHVSASYIPIGPRRKADECALASVNYRTLLIVRDASYYILCRSEVSIGQTVAERATKTPKAAAYAAIYDLLKTIGVDMRARPNEPTTPPGGFSACAAGVVDGNKDPFPTQQHVLGFNSRLNVPDSEKQRIGSPEKQ